MLRGQIEAGKGAAPGSPEARNAQAATSLLNDLNTFGTDKSVIAAFGPDGKPAGAASYRIDEKGILNVDNVVTLPGSGTGEALMQELFARAPSHRMSATATDDTRSLYVGLGGVENPPGVFSWTKTPARTGPGDGATARLPVPGDDPFRTNFDGLDDAFGGPSFNEDDDLLTDLFDGIRFDDNSGFEQDTAPRPLTGPASRVVNDPAALAQMETRLRASFDGPVSFIQDSRVTDPGTVVITLSGDGKTVEIRHGSGVDPQLMDTLEIAGKLGGARYIKDIFALQGSPEQITKDAARLMRPLSLLGPTGTANEFGLVILGDGEKGWVHPAIALKADGSVPPHQALNVGTIENPSAIRAIWKLHPHALGYGAVPLYPPDGLSEADLRYADVAYRVFTGRETEGEIGTLAEQRGRFPNLDELTLASVSDLGTLAKTTVAGDADGTTVQSDVEVGPVVPGVPFPDRYFEGLAQQVVVPRPGETTFNVNDLMNDANAASGLPEALTRAADALINDRLPVIGTGDGMITSLQRLGTELPKLHDLWHGIPATADPTTTLAYLDLKTMQLTIRTPDGDSVLSPNFTPAAPNARQQEILNAGADDPRYLDTVRELVGVQPGTTPGASPQTGGGMGNVSPDSGTSPEARLPSGPRPSPGDVLRMTRDEIAALPADRLQALRESFGQQLAAATGAKTPAPDLANAYSRVLGAQIVQAEAALGNAPLDQILRRYAPTGEPDWKQKLGELPLEERYAVLGRVAQDPKRVFTSPEVATVRGLLSTLPPDPAFVNSDIARLLTLDAALRADPMIAGAEANWDTFSPEQQTAALQRVASYTAKAFGLPEPALEIGPLEDGRTGGYRVMNDDMAAASGSSPAIRLAPKDPMQPLGFGKEAQTVVHEMMHLLQDRSGSFQRMGQIAPGDIDYASSLAFGANLLPRVYDSTSQNRFNQPVEAHAYGIDASFKRLLDQHPAAFGEPPLRLPDGSTQDVNGASSSGPVDIKAQQNALNATLGNMKVELRPQSKLMEGAASMSLAADGTVVIDVGGTLTSAMEQMLRLIDQQGGRQWIQGLFDKTGSAAERIEAISRELRVPSLLQNSTVELAMGVADTPAGPVTIHRLAMGADGKVPLSAVMTGLNRQIAGQMSSFHMTHTHPVGAQFPKPDGSMTTSLRETGLGQGDLTVITWWFDVLRGQTPGRSSFHGAAPNLKEATLGSIGSLDPALTTVRVTGEPGQPAVVSDLTVKGAVPGVPIAGSVMNPTQLTPVVDAETQTIDQGDLLRSLAADARVGPPATLRPIGDQHSAMMSAAQLLELPGARALYPKILTLPRDETVTVSLMTGELTTAGGKRWSPAYPVNRDVALTRAGDLEKGTGSTPADLKRYMDILAQVLTPAQGGTSQP